VCNGVSQGGVLSPFLFCVYIRDLINSVVNCNVACHIAGICVNLLAYADDYSFTGSVLVWASEVT